MENEPILLYGVNLGRISKVRRKGLFRELEIEDPKDNQISHFDMTRMRNLSVSNFLNLGISNHFEEVESYQLGQIHIGNQIRRGYPERQTRVDPEKYVQEGIMFNEKQITGLLLNADRGVGSSRVIARFHDLGLDIDRKDLALYVL